jgi:P4 family phage/plasmid primase-like protien
MSKQTERYTPLELDLFKNAYGTPKEYTDVDEAVILCDKYSNVLRHCDGIGFLTFTGVKWEESETEARNILKRLTDEQISEINKTLIDIHTSLGKAKTDDDEEREKQLKKEINAFSDYRSFVLSRRQSHGIDGTLKEVRGLVRIQIKDLDSNGFLLNTPEGTIDLRTGTKKPHNSDDLCTKVTNASPNNDNLQEWIDAVKIFCRDDMELLQYLQAIAGMFAIGKVFCENLIVAIGEGRNGKSTFFNTIMGVLGDYSGGIESSVFTTGYKGNVGPELAELRGKRLVIAAELDEGTRLNTASLKKICSTDDIRAQAKYQKPFSFTPTHSTILYTNHLPRVSSIDDGTWRRLIIVPFKANIKPTQDKTNYTDYLIRHCGGAVLTWIIDGAKAFIDNGCKLPPMPAAVKEATERYREDNNWLEKFITEWCDLGDNFSEQSSVFYTSYKTYCEKIGEYCHKNNDFKSALLARGFTCKKTNTGVIYYGIRSKPSPPIMIPTHRTTPTSISIPLPPVS